MKDLFCTLVLTALMSGLLSWSCPSWAGLGRTPADFEREAQLLRAQPLAEAKSVGEFKSYSFQTGSSLIRQYVSNDGVVVAVTWTGRTHPDFAVLFGPFYGEFTQHHVPFMRGRRSSSVTTGHIQIELVGRSGQMKGCAYWIEQMPTDFSCGDLEK